LKACGSLLMGSTPTCVCISSIMSFEYLGAEAINC
jgi:hypothetical protein